MKELSIEKKAKRYDEAIKRGLDYIRHTPATEMVTRQDIFEAIFPEFKESEDEKIRKWLIYYFKEVCDNVSEKEKKGVLSWLEKQGEKDKFIEKELGCIKGYRENAIKRLEELEKQGEQKPNYCHHEVDLSDCSEEYRKAYYDGWNNCNMQHSQCRSELDDVVKCLINGMKFYYEDNEEATWGTDKWSIPVKHIIEVLEKQCEQNPADKVEPKFKVGDVIRLKGSAAEYTIKRVTDTTYYTDGWSCGIKRCEKDYELVKQKPSAWSEEDEKTWEELIEEVKDQIDSVPAPDCRVREDEKVLKQLNKWLTWLKSLKDRVQPKQEWSGGDEAHLHSLITHLEQWIERHPNTTGADIQGENIAWLKSLRPQSQWKPSTIQMNALESAIEVLDADEDGLTSLFEQLKKLREEDV